MPIHWHTRETIHCIVRRHVLPAATVLDIGSGIRPQTYVVPLVHICCDPFPQYVDYLRKWAQTEQEGVLVPLLASWRDVATKLPDRCVDTIFLLDIIEHIEKPEGLELLALTERLARKQIVVFTPLGFMPQSFEGTKDAWGLDGAELQEHRSGWYPDRDFNDTWEIHACSDFHFGNSNSGIPDKPFGAFWAIKTIANRNDSERSEVVLDDLNRILASLGGSALTVHEFAGLALQRCRSAVRRLESVTAEKERCFAAAGATLSAAQERCDRECAKLSSQLECTQSKNAMLENQLAAVQGLLEQAQSQLALVQRSLSYRIAQAIARRLRR